MKTKYRMILFIVAFVLVWSVLLFNVTSHSTPGYYYPVYECYVSALLLVLIGLFYK